MAVLPAEVIAEARSLPRMSSMSLITTVAPSRASVCTQASPIPDAPPVTSAIFPSTWPMRQLPLRRAEKRSAFRQASVQLPTSRNTLRSSALQGLPVSPARGRARTKKIRAKLLRFLDFASGKQRRAAKRGERIGVNARLPRCERLRNSLLTGKFLRFNREFRMGHFAGKGVVTVMLAGVYVLDMF